MFFSQLGWYSTRVPAGDASAILQRDALDGLGLRIALGESGRSWPTGKKGTGPICRNGPQGASHKFDLSPFSEGRDSRLAFRCNRSNAISRPQLHGSILTDAGGF